VDVIKTIIASAMNYGGEWLGYKGGNAEEPQRVLNRAMKIAMGDPCKSKMHESFTLSMELGIPQIEVTQNGLRTRRYEKIKGGKISTHLYNLLELVYSYSSPTHHSSRTE
jgi:hypothetical protein